MTATVVTLERASWPGTSWSPTPPSATCQAMRTPRLPVGVLGQPRDDPALAGHAAGRVRVVKSAVSSVGRQVCVLHRRPDGDGSRDVYVEPDGLVWPMADLKMRIARMPRPIFAEEIVLPHPQLGALSPHGTLCDLRLHFVGTDLGGRPLPRPHRSASLRGMYGNVGRGALGTAASTPTGAWTPATPSPACTRRPRWVAGQSTGWSCRCLGRGAGRVAQSRRAVREPARGRRRAPWAPTGRFTVIEVTLVPDTKCDEPARQPRLPRRPPPRPAQAGTCVEAWWHRRPVTCGTGWSAGSRSRRWRRRPAMDAVGAELR